MVIPVGEAGVQELVVLIKKNGKLEKHSIIAVLFVPMVNRRWKPY